METIPLAIVTLLPLSTSVTLGPVPVPPPGMFAGTRAVAPTNATSASKAHRTRAFLQHVTMASPIARENTETAYPAIAFHTTLS